MASSEVAQPIETGIAELQVQTLDLATSLQAWTERLPVRLLAIWPADDPAVAVLEMMGMRFRLTRGAPESSSEVVIRIPEAGLDGEVLLDNIRFAPAPDPRRGTLDLGPSRPVLHLARADGEFVVGRAGMRYQDLLPERQGGRFVVSRIRIDEGGPVPDFVHYHRVRFQALVCTRGAVRVVYEGQGEPIWMKPGDCVLQPPGIRHRVLEASDGLEVVEVGCPAIHATEIDHEMELPNQVSARDRSWQEQRFCLSRRDDGSFEPAGALLRYRTGLGEATAGLAGLEWWRADPGSGFGPGVGSGNRSSSDSSHDLAHDGEFRFVHLTAGSTRFFSSEVEEELRAGDSLTIPAGAQASFAGWSPDLEWFEFRLPAAPNPPID